MSYQVVEIPSGFPHVPKRILTPVETVEAGVDYLKAMAGGKFMFGEADAENDAFDAFIDGFAATFAVEPVK